MKSNWRDQSAVMATLYKNRLGFYNKLINVVLDSNSYSDEITSKAKGYLRSGRYDLLLELADSLGGAVHPTARDHFLANQFAALIKKMPLDLRKFGIDPERAAIEKFLASERRVGRQNLHFTLEHKFKRYRSISYRASMRDWIRKVLGDKPDYPEIWSKCDFGPGASVGVSGNATHLAAKLLAPRWSVTSTALPYALAALRSHSQMWELLIPKGNEAQNFSWDPLLFEDYLMDKVMRVDYNKIVLVPKTAKVHRTIAVEPLLNGYLQKGVDVFMRRRLFRYGIDLNDQSRNQEMARQGSLPGEDTYSTIDLSEASDSISIGLVKDLLPPDWFEFLNSIRSPSFLLDGKVTRYNKFCSMGNGFCFPLESLIFASVCQAVYNRHNRGTDFSVYGDDIIVRSSLASEILKVLSLLGFRHNPLKTFIQGPFRESCGADWFLGEDVRPVTVDLLPETIQEYFSLHNQTLRNSSTKNYFEDARSYIRSCIPPRYRFMRPYQGNMDTAFQVEKDLFMSSPFASFDRVNLSWKWRELVTFSTNDRAIRKRALYQIALLQAALKGASSQTPFTKRRNTRTRVEDLSHHGGYSTWLPSDIPVRYG